MVTKALSTFNRNTEAAKGFTGSAIAESTAGAFVQLGCEVGNVVVRVVFAGAILGKELAGESVRVFVRTALPGAMRVGEVHVHPQAT